MCGIVLSPSSIEYLNDLNAASQRLENVLNYEFEHVGEFYSESLFGAMKLDNNVIGDLLEFLEKAIHWI